MRAPYRMERLSGLAAGVLGLLVLGFVLFGPLYLTSGQECTGGPTGTAHCTTLNGAATFFEVNTSLQPVTIFYLSFLAVLFVGIAFLAVWHSRSRSSVLRACLWGLTGLLALSTGIGMASVGLFFVPSLVLAVIASAAAANSERLGAS
ncbi:MAG TPA: hypothetical protein VKT82_08665 [Ktedonobacterales bacterium]|nr:hypothetical protein [Ktedonobacterales bacterium]